jgi:hypothetical protein
MAGFSSLANKAREIFNKRGGTEAAKGDLQELKDIHARRGSMSDKAKAAVDVLKEPGMKGPDRSAPPKEETPRPRAPVWPGAPIGPGFVDERFAGLPASGAATGRRAISTGSRGTSKAA